MKFKYFNIAGIILQVLDKLFLVATVILACLSIKFGYKFVKPIPFIMIIHAMLPISKYGVLFVDNDFELTNEYCAYE
jgi:hypothetical protein